MDVRPPHGRAQGWRFSSLRYTGGCSSLVLSQKMARYRNLSVATSSSDVPPVRDSDRDLAMRNHILSCTYFLGNEAWVGVLVRRGDVRRMMITTHAPKGTNSAVLDCSGPVHFSSTPLLSVRLLAHVYMFLVVRCLGHAPHLLCWSCFQYFQYDVEDSR